MVGRARWLAGIAAALLAWCTLGAVAGARAEAPPDLARLAAPDSTQQAWFAAQLYRVVTTAYAHREALPADYDFEAVFRAFLHEAMAAPSRLAFDKAALRLFASLRNGHTVFLDLVARQEPPLPFTASRLDGHWIVTCSMLTGLHPGDEIATLDGQPFDAWTASLLDLLQQSNRTQAEQALIASAYLWPRRFTLTLADGRHVPVDRLSVASPGPTQPSPDRVTTPRPGIVLLRIPGFMAPQSEADALDALRDHKAAKAVVIDLRGNIGGNTPAALIGALVLRPYQDMIDASPLHVGVLDAWARIDRVMLPQAMLRTGGEIVRPDHPLYAGRLLLLTDAGCASACEDFVLAMRLSHRATIVGQTTHGSTGQPYVVDLPDMRMRFLVSTRREYFPDLSRFEGVGVVPDVVVPLSAASLRAGKDDVMDKALALAASP